jgi:hypothetical protein
LSSTFALLGLRRAAIPASADCNWPTHGSLEREPTTGHAFIIHQPNAPSGGLQGGTSNVAFSYRIVAKRKDIKRHARFAKIDMPVFPMPVGKSRAARGRKPPRLPSSMRALFTALEKEARKKAT